MSANKKLKNLLQASEAASHNSTCQHIVLSVSSDGKVHAAGSDNLVTARAAESWYRWYRTKQLWLDKMKLR